MAKITNIEEVRARHRRAVPVVRISIEELHEQTGFCRVPVCPRCGAELEHYDGGEAQNYEAEGLRACANCGLVCDDDREEF